MSKKRPTIGAKQRLRIMKRDRFRCQVCGKSPSLDPGVILEVDHIKPSSKDGDNSDDNLHTLCFSCNRGKGDNKSLNKKLTEEINNLLDRINPQILIDLKKQKIIRVVANSEDFLRLKQLNDLCNYLKIEVIPNTIHGYHAGYSLGIYTVEDNNGVKANFSLSIN